MSFQINLSLVASVIQGGGGLSSNVLYNRSVLVFEMRKQLITQIEDIMNIKYKDSTLEIAVFLHHSVAHSEI